MSQDWLTAEDACKTLGVRSQTLYAYVSRKLLRSRHDEADPRRKLYLRADVEELAQKHRRPRGRSAVAANAIRWGEPLLTTRISGVKDGVLYLGSVPAVELARTATLEDAASHLWGVKIAVDAPTLRARVPSGRTALTRGLLCLAHEAATSPPMQGRSRDALALDGARLLRIVVGAMLNDASGSASPSHVRLASGWKLKSQGAEAVRMALVLICDHELNPSTFAVRVCASTGGSLAAALLAGLATLSGPRHGGAAANTLNALTASLGGNTSRNAFLTANPSLTPYDYGFGHPLYPNGDPRAAALLNLPGSQAAVRRAVEQLAILTGAAPNIDMALAALAKTYALPSDAPFIIFAIGRLVGWVAHAIEQIESRQMIRPRAHFVGVETQGE